MFCCIISYAEMSDSIHKHKIFIDKMRSVFELDNIKALINNIRTRQDNGDDLTESDYNLITGAILPYYFSYNIGWIIGAGSLKYRPVSKTW